MCYKLTTKENSSVEAAGRFLAYTDSAEDLRIAEEAAAGWHIAFRWIFECCAESDGGIDARDVKAQANWDIPARWIVLEDGKATGVYMHQHLFLFDDPETWELSIEHNGGFVGGWGDITEYEEYTLMEGPGPGTGKDVLEVAAAIMMDEQDRVFVTQRGYGNYKDWWEFPGGKLEPGESPEAAAVREIQEELGAEVKAERFLKTTVHEYEEYHVILHCWLCTITGGELTLKEHEAAKWLAEDEYGKVRWLPSDLAVLDEIRGEIRKREFYRKYPDGIVR